MESFSSTSLVVFRPIVPRTSNGYYAQISVGSPSSYHSRVANTFARDLRLECLKKDCLKCWNSKT